MTTNVQIVTPGSEQFSKALAKQYPAWLIPAGNLRSSITYTEFKAQAQSVAVLTMASPIQTTTKMAPMDDTRDTTINALRVLANFAGALIVVGLVLGFTYPGRLTGALLPIGLALWWLAGFLGRRYDSSTGN
jgi:hypothetical protein